MSGQAMSDQVRFGYVTQVMSGQVRSRNVRKGQDVSDHIMSGQVKSYQSWSRSLRSGQTRSGYVMSVQIKIRPSRGRDCRSCQTRSGQDQFSSREVRSDQDMLGHVWSRTCQVRSCQVISGQFQYK